MSKREPDSTSEVILADRTIAPERNGSHFEPLMRLAKDLKLAAATLGRGEIRYLVDTFYEVQRYRISSAAQVRAQGEDAEPNRLLDWLSTQMETLEGDIKRALDAWSDTYRVGVWLKGLTGIGPVIAAGLLAHLDIEGCPTAGHFWRFAGLDPSQSWGKGEKRPWNARLKTLIAFKLGESFVKVQGRKSDFYGKLFAERKAEEWRNNLAGKLSDYARQTAEKKRFGDDTNAKLWYSGQIATAWAQGVVDGGLSFPATIPTHAKCKDGQPMLPPAHIHARARRWAVKLFLSHLHHVMHVDFYGTEPPRPYVFVHSPGDHRHYIAPPNLPLGAGRSLKELRKEEATAP